MTGNTPCKILSLAASVAGLLLAPGVGHAAFDPPFTLSGINAQVAVVGSSAAGDALVVWGKFPESVGPVRLQARASSVAGILGPI